MAFERNISKTFLFIAMLVLCGCPHPKKLKSRTLIPPPPIPQSSGNSELLEPENKLFFASLPQFEPCEFQASLPPANGNQRHEVVLHKTQLNDVELTAPGIRQTWEPCPPVIQSWGRHAAVQPQPAHALRRPHKYNQKPLDPAKQVHDNYPKLKPDQQPPVKPSKPPVKPVKPPVKPGQPFLITWLIIALISFIATLIFEDMFPVRFALTRIFSQYIEVLASPPIELAQSAANERRNSIEAFFRRNGIEGKPNFRSVCPAVEYLESPGIRNREPILLDDLQERIGQMIRLRWQLECDEWLLLERVVDFLVMAKREFGWPFETSWISAVSLRKVSETLGEGLFPWKVVISVVGRLGSHFRLAAQLRDFMMPINVLGIGIDIEQARPFTAFSSCGKYAFKRGVVGGSITLFGSKFLMTCQHVIDERCQCVASAGISFQEPDAALLTIPSCKFPARIGTPIQMSNEKKLQSGGAVIRNHYSRPKQLGEILNITTWYVEKRGKPLRRFPSVQIKPTFAEFWNLLPYRFQAFSRKGDSGSWVIRESEGEWVGMVAVGNPGAGTTVVLQADALVEFFKTSLWAAGKRGPEETIVVCFDSESREI